MLTLKQILYDLPSLEQFDQHIQQSILPGIEQANNRTEFLDYVQQVKLSLNIDHKRFFCLLWYATMPEYQSLLDKQERPEKANAFKQILVKKLDYAILGVSETGDKYTKRSDKSHKFMNTIGSLLDSLRLEYIQL